MMLDFYKIKAIYIFKIIWNDFVEKRKRNGAQINQFKKCEVSS